jgi:uncharacterized protein (TIGR02646 family)
MRRITKNSEPVSLCEFKKKHKDRDHSEAQYGDLTYEDRVSIRDSLVAEQYGLCAYCMSAIKTEGCHIEHIKPKSTFPKLSLEYSNMIASCNSDKSCGIHKGDKYSDDFVAPTEKDCETEYSYTMDGRIRSRSNRACYTIKLLNLNSHKLKNARKAAIKSSGLYNDDFDEFKKDILNYYSYPNEKGYLPSFCMAVLWAIENH